MDINGKMSLGLRLWRGMIFNFGVNFELLPGENIYEVETRN